LALVLYIYHHIEMVDNNKLKKEIAVFKSQMKHQTNV